MLRDQIQEKMKDAMKARDVVRMAAIKYVWSEIRYKEIDKKADLNDEEILDLLNREVKKRRETLDQMKVGG